MHSLLEKNSSAPQYFLLSATSTNAAALRLRRNYGRDFLKLPYFCTDIKFELI